MAARTSPQDDKKHWNALMIALIYMALGVLLAAAFSINKIELGATFGIIMLGPLLLYLILSGSISEFSAPGGFGAKFREAAAAPVKTGATIEGLEFVSKADHTALVARARGVTPGKPVALAFGLNDPAAVYNAMSIEQYLHTLRKIDPDVSIVFTNPNGTFAASTDGARVESILSNDHYSAEFIQAAQGGDLGKLRELVSASSRSVSEKTTNAEALRIMNEDGVRSLVAVDAGQRPVGVVRRDRIISEMVAGMAG